MRYVELPIHIYDRKEHEKNRELGIEEEIEFTPSIGMFDTFEISAYHPIRGNPKDKGCLAYLRSGHDFYIDLSYEVLKEMIDEK